MDHPTVLDLCVPVRLADIFSSKLVRPSTSAPLPLMSNTDRSPLIAFFHFADAFLVRLRPDSGLKY